LTPSPFFYNDYLAARIYFTDTIPDDLFTELKRSRLSHFITCLRELNIAFVPFESRVFLIDTAARYYNIITNRRGAQLERYAEQIATVCSTFRESFEIRFQSQNENCADLARLVNSKVKPDPFYQSKLIIIDRGYDPVAPLVHELTYQAMIYDLLDADGDVIKIENNRPVLMDELNDPIWKKYRHAHMATCMKMIATRFDELQKRKKRKFDNGKPTVSQLAELMQQMPQYQREIATVQLHMELVELCDQHYDERVNEMCDAEQDLACEQLSNKMAQKLIIPWLLNEEISAMDKIRMILLYAINQGGISEEQLIRLIKHASLSAADEEVIRSMAHFNVKVLKNDQNRGTRQMDRKDHSEAIKYQDSRYVPAIKDIMQVCLLYPIFLT